MTFIEEEEVFPTLSVDDTLENKQENSIIEQLEEKDTKPSAKRKEPEAKTEKKVDASAYCYYPFADIACYCFSLLCFSFSFYVYHVFRNCYCFGACATYIHCCIYWIEAEDEEDVLLRRGVGLIVVGWCC